MTISVERIEVLGISVIDLTAAEALFSDLFGIRFRRVTRTADAPPRPLRPVDDVDDPTPLSAGRLTVSADLEGMFELIEREAPEGVDGFRNIHVKVPDLAAAVAELRARGIRVIAHAVYGGLREAIAHPGDVFGIRLCLVEYDAPSMVEAMRQDDDDRD